jgi:nucleotide-binding universal stress UspA family protein
MTRHEMYDDATTVPVPVAGEIVVGLNESPSAAAALRWATEQSRVTGLPLRVVYAWQLKALEAAAAGYGARELWEAMTADARARATRWVLDTLGGTAAEVRWTLDIVEGPPGSVLVGRSRAARLLVLGTREHTGLRRAVVGSVSHYCLSHAEPPVVGVPGPREQAPGLEAAGTAVVASG